MALVTLQELYKSFGENSVLEGISLQFHKGEKLGLVGPNGSGKTTLLKIITGEEEKDSGDLFFSKGLTWGYLSQKPGLLPEITLRDYLFRAVGDIVFLKDQLAFLEKKMSLPHVKENRELTAKLMEKYGELSHLFEEKKGYTLEARVEDVARGLGFEKEDLAREMASFSGGEKTRAQLASLLLNEPELLLLDEPTNSLDFDAVEWLEGYLQNWRGALLVVSHDRFFLDRVVHGIASLEEKKVKYYRGNYSAFIFQRQQDRVTLEKTFKKQHSAWKKDLEFIRNAKADERTKKQARSREKRLGKMEPLQELKTEESMNADFKFAGRSGKIVARLENVSRYFGEYKIFDGVNLEINWGDRLAVVGPNGSGKSTLLKVMTGELFPNSGKVFIGPAVEIAYFDQEQKELHPESTPLKIIYDASEFTESEARKHLGKYLFKGEEVFKRVGELSGGEKSRLAIALMALNQSNFLIMDEPTNHLDIAGMEELEAALDNFPGTLLLVSHDRYFISRLAAGILEVRESQVSYFKGSFENFLKFKTQQQEGPSYSRGHSEEKKKRLKQREEEKKQHRKQEAQKKHQQRLKEMLKAQEEEILQEEERAAELEKKLAEQGIYEDYDKARDVMEELKRVREKVDDLYSRWEEIAGELENFSMPVQ